MSREVCHFFNAEYRTKWWTPLKYCWRFHYFKTNFNVDIYLNKKFTLLLCVLQSDFSLFRDSSLFQLKKISLLNFCSIWRGLIKCGHIKQSVSVYSKKITFVYHFSYWFSFELIKLLKLSKIISRIFQRWWFCIWIFAVLNTSVCEQINRMWFTRLIYLHVCLSNTSNTEFWSMTFAGIYWLSEVLVDLNSTD